MAKNFITGHVIKIFVPEVVEDRLQYLDIDFLTTRPKEIKEQKL